MTQTSLSRAHSTIALSSSFVYTPPVGSDGDEKIRPFVFGVHAFSRSAGVSAKSRSSAPFTGTGVARASVTISG